MAEFIWTDELVKEFVIAYNSHDEMVTGCDPILKKVDEFKASKQKPKEWEIVTSFDLDGKGGIHPFIPKDEPCGCVEEGCKIHSVRRLGDGEVFTVGDLTNLGQITGFYNRWAGMEAHFGNEGALFSSLKKSRTPLFTTEDGKHIYKGDTVYQLSVNEDWKIRKLAATEYSAPVPDFFKYFSTEDAAKEYVRMNKPCFSYKEVDDAVSELFKGDHRIAIIDKYFIKLAKQKTNQ